MIAADCQAEGCLWRVRLPKGSPAELRALVDLIVTHCREKHTRACREIRVVIHAAGEHCDHERPE